MMYVSKGFSKPLDLRVHVPGEWIVLEDIEYTSLSGKVYIVPRGFVTDLASIPKIAQVVYSIDDETRCPAVLHDWLYCTKQTSREEADSLLKEAITRANSAQFKANSFWIAVRMGGWLYWNKRNGIREEDFVKL